MYRWCSLGVMAVALATAVGCGEVDPEPADATKLHSELEGRLVTVEPRGPTFRIPDGWLARYEKQGKNLHLSREEIESVRAPKGEWDPEFAEVVDSVLDFDRCSFHGGDEGWGLDSRKYSDLQMRVYLVSPEPAALEARLDEEGANAVREIRSADRQRRGDDLTEKSGTPEPPKRDTSGAWRRSLFSFELYYHDYGSTAKVDFRLRRFGSATVAVVFMYTDFQSQEETISGILDSVRWED